MSSIGTALRRTLLLLVIAAAVGAAVSLRRGQSSTPAPAAPPQWPPWPADPQRSGATRTDHAAPAEPTAAPTPSPSPLGGGSGWLPAHADGSAPETHPIKVNVSSGIFHVPGGRFYDRTKPQRCYPTAAAAEADGYRRSKT